MKINLQSKKSFIDQKIRDYSSSTKTLIGRSSIDHEEKFDIWRSEIDDLIKIDQMRWIKLKPWLVVSWIRWKFCETLILTCRSHTRLILFWTVKDEMMKMWGGILGQKLGYDNHPLDFFIRNLPLMQYNRTFELNFWYTHQISSTPKYTKVYLKIREYRK